MLKNKPNRVFARMIAMLTAVTIALPPPLPLAASPAMEKLLYVLKTKGSLTQDEYDMLVAAMRADEKKEATPQVAASSGTGLDRRLSQTESKVQNLENAITSTKGQVEEMSRITDGTSPSTMSKGELDALLADKWYERLKFGGYAQIRADSVLSDDGGVLHVPADPFANEQSSIGIRRGRIKFSGDITSHVYMYLQADYFGTVSGSNVLQARDYYADISLDPARDFRVRLGLSKVPYGWSNMQSSQNRLALERPDAINSAVEGERDLGAFFYWAPYAIRNRFKDLVKLGLRGSGDYGLIAIGAYSGQGINRSDLNGSPHYVARVTYPFEFSNGQFFEIGLQGYTGNFVPTTAAAAAGGIPTAPTFTGNGVADRRVGISAVLYPQPFGIETEWNWGEGPELAADRRSIQSSGLRGGYVQANYRHVFASQQELIPFVRWQTYNGGRKFATNAPHSEVDEVGVGLRYIPYPELEMTVMYNHGSRTNTNVAPYAGVNYDYIGLQAQINF